MLAGTGHAVAIILGDNDQFKALREEGFAFVINDLRQKFEDIERLADSIDMNSLKR